MTVRIVTDSSCDLPQAMADALGIRIVPLSVRFGDTEYIDRTTITATEFWSKCAASATLPETAAPSPGSFEETYRSLAAEGATAIVVVALSSDLSATMQSAELAARAVSPGIDVRIVDSRNASMGLGLTVLACAELAKTGASADEVVARAQSVIPRTRVFAALDTLDNLKKGGRIGGAKAMLATVMSIKPLISITNGLVEEAGKQRTRSKALAHLVEILRNQEVPIERLAVLNAQCADIDAFIAMVKEVYTGEIIVGDIGAVIGTHAGQGTIGIVFLLSA
ncbi:MAG: DegV family protein [Ilumatobacteraceae bacterium]|jgi:DegV family protein with EDD domain|nr:DegV family protein [Ilumatobacteraceae bacterium]